MFTEAQLVSFGNYLLLTYGVQVHSTDGKNIPVYQREVTDADFCNWKETQKDNGNTLPSRFQLDDKVSVRFRPDFVINEARVIKVHFTESKVLYDLEVKISFEGNSDHPAGFTTTRVYNIDSSVVEPV
jgi:hypothetical protein